MTMQPPKAELRFTAKYAKNCYAALKQITVFGHDIKSQSANDPLLTDFLSIYHSLMMGATPPPMQYDMTAITATAISVILIFFSVYIYFLAIVRCFFQRNTKTKRV